MCTPRYVYQIPKFPNLIMLQQPELNGREESNTHVVPHLHSVRNWLIREVLLIECSKLAHSNDYNNRVWVAVVCHQNFGARAQDVEWEACRPRETRTMVN